MTVFLVKHAGVDDFDRWTIEEREDIRIATLAYPTGKDLTITIDGDYNVTIELDGKHLGKVTDVVFDLFTAMLLFDKEYKLMSHSHVIKGEVDTLYERK